MFGNFVWHKHCVFFCRQTQRWCPDWENIHWLSEKLASLGLMRAKSRALIKPLNTIVLWWLEEFPVRQYLGQLYVWTWNFSFQSGLIWFESRMTHSMPFFIWILLGKGNQDLCALDFCGTFCRTWCTSFLKYIYIWIYVYHCHCIFSQYIYKYFYTFFFWGILCRTQ